MGTIGFRMTPSINHGKPKQMRMSKTLLPIEFEIAMPPLPRRAISIDETTSGKLVPAAKKVKPATVSGTLILSPKI